MFELGTYSCKDCERCGNVGSLHVRCRPCNGVGLVDFDGDDIRCHDCDGEGEFEAPCPCCSVWVSQLLQTCAATLGGGHG